ncbi:MAG TPA: Crp/Fnr family transcriptional regulator [Candidatus Binatia bacterium]|nr:Crp/Fnr family transcriptional regulator [Candidatus Binatia bacterium]
MATTGKAMRPANLASDARRSRRLALGLRRLGWPEESIGRFLETAELITFPRGRVIYREGSAATRLYWMLDGVAKLFVPGSLGRRVLVSLAKPGALLGSHLVVGGRRLDTAIALTPIHAAAIDMVEFQDIVRELPVDVTALMTRGTLDYYSRTFLRTVKLLTLDLRGKLALGLLDLAEGFGVAEAQGRLVKVRLTHEDLAELTGISRARVTKTIAEFSEQGLVVRRGRDLVVRVRELREVAGF